MTCNPRSLRSEVITGHPVAGKNDKSSQLQHSLRKASVLGEFVHGLSATAESIPRSRAFWFHARQTEQTSPAPMTVDQMPCLEAF